MGKGAQRGCAVSEAGVSAPPATSSGWWGLELDSIAATGILGRLGIAVTHCIPHHPQSKAIERFFRTMHERFDRCWPTYTSGDPFTRPESTDLAMMQHRRLLKAGRVAESKHPLASRFILACLAAWRSTATRRIAAKAWTARRLGRSSRPTATPTKSPRPSTPRWLS